MNNSLVLSGGSQIVSVDNLIDNLSQKRELATIFIKSGLIPYQLNTPEKVLVAMFKAQELNIPTLEGLASMAVINGKVTLQGNLMLALISRSGKVKKIDIKEFDGGCSVFMARRDYDLSYTFTFTFEDARSAGLTGKDIWKKYGKTMLKWRAVSGCARVVVPDVIGGLYTPEEIASIDDTPMEVDEEGNIIVLDNATETPNDKPVEVHQPEHTEPPQPKKEYTDQGIKGKITKANDLDELKKVYALCTKEQAERLKEFFTAKKNELFDPTELEKPSYWINRIEKIENVFELKNWLKKHKPDLDQFGGEDLEKIRLAIDNKEQELK